MAISITKNLSTTEYDANGNLIVASYWRIQTLSANPLSQTFTLIYAGFASATAFNANPLQTPLATQTVCYPDPVNAPNVSWPFAPGALATNYPGNPLAILFAADAYAMLNPFFSGAEEVS